jgi:hypothetical protein
MPAVSLDVVLAWPRSETHYGLIGVCPKSYDLVSAAAIQKTHKKVSACVEFT